MRPHAYTERMLSRHAARVAVFVLVMLLAVGAQSARVFAINGVNPDIFIAALPALALLLPTLPAFLLVALSGIAALKITPSFEAVSLALLLVAVLIFFAQKFMPWHPVLSHAACIAVGVVLCYALVNEPFLSAHPAVIAAELGYTAGVGVLCSMIALYTGKSF